MELDIFEDRQWQMSLGERAALEGVLTRLKPALAIEIGSADGAALQRIAAHAREVHSFDLTPPSLPVADNVRLHTGDSHQLLPELLVELAAEGRNVGLVIVDGDHSPEGVRQDLEDLLDSRALADTMIVIHDTANPRVRQGVEAVRFSAWPKVTHVDLDWVPGRLFAEPELRNELWYGLGLVMVDSSRPAYMTGSVYEQRYHPAGELLVRGRDAVVARELAPAGLDEGENLEFLRAQLLSLTAELSAAWARELDLEQALRTALDRSERADRTLRDVMGSPSWRITAPLRGAKRLAGRRRG